MWVSVARYGTRPMIVQPCRKRWNFRESSSGHVALAPHQTAAIDVIASSSPQRINRGASPGTAGRCNRCGKAHGEIPPPRRRSTALQGAPVSRTIVRYGGSGGGMLDGSNRPHATHPKAAASCRTPKPASRRESVSRAEVSRRWRAPRRRRRGRLGGRVVAATPHPGSYGEPLQGARPLRRTIVR